MTFRKNGKRDAGDNSTGDYLCFHCRHTLKPTISGFISATFQEKWLEGHRRDLSHRLCRITITVGYRTGNNLDTISITTTPEYIGEQQASWRARGHSENDAQRRCQLAMRALTPPLPGEGAVLEASPGAKQMGHFRFIPHRNIT